MEAAVAMPEPVKTAQRLADEMGRVVVGQRPLVEGLLVALLSGGHALVEGVPGLAKTTAIRTLAQVLGLGFGRIQFTPDLLPGDLLGTPIYEPARGTFVVRRGPIFAPVLLADEINRAPAKVQSALLEAMEERQVSIGDETHPLPDPFFVMATQNPVELEGTYPLPEAQIDRFLVKLVVPYPEADEEVQIVARDAQGPVQVGQVADLAELAALRQAAGAVHVAPALVDYAVRLARATRDPAAAGARITDATGAPAPERCVALGASPRGSIYLVRAARARALLDGRDYATPHDLKRVAPDVLRHRVVPSYEAEAAGVTAESVVRGVLAAVETA
ncbi:MAG TPA: MoxR family ATPase [Myxococcota bacterium]|nr:MoxR family ATPase [Myxococcota bacterium]